ncbi:pyridoxamine 5'-phosphate oxidase family protein [Clostridium cylindrosporum]|uniref:Putative flavin-nucleotide-binding protein n=1 Tax=Clostridium cylindrosporum DSM 605 TaxID=1121307 RepID=A0A0J8D9L4_CLOCY|nr:pyridoxamine 5'-phosphate oxidase family protein [Clostridium cylindrosporum]KMT22522.1 putative flavin-nucleotide-binding protein [Clostridium cylindrosporum DSM 605]
MSNVRRKDREIDEKVAYDLLVNTEYAILGTINVEDGTPYCIPISPVVEEDYIYFHCAPVGQKVDNIKNNPNVCVTCVGDTNLVPEQFTTEYESTVVKGVAGEVTEDEEKIFALRKICEKFAPSNMDNFQKAVNASLKRTNIYKIKIQSISGKGKKVKR